MVCLNSGGAVTPSHPKLFCVRLMRAGVDDTPRTLGEIRAAAEQYIDSVSTTHEDKERVDGCYAE